MLFRIAAYEFRYMFFSLQTLVSAASIFALAFLFTANGVEFQTTARGGNVFINSPYMIAQFLILLSLLVVFITPSYVAGSVLKDCENSFDGILFATPISKTDYLFGRFLGGFCALAVVIATGPIGMFLGTFWPWAVSETIAVNDISHYITVFLLFLMPSLFTVSAVIFAVAVMSRSMLFSYFAALALIILFITVDISDSLSAIWDPFMAEAFAEQTKYWTAIERNTNLLGYNEVILSNRVLWLLVALSSLVLAYCRFSFRTTARTAKENPLTLQAQRRLQQRMNQDFRISPQWTKSAHWQQWLFRTRFEMMSVLKSTPFLLLMAISFFLLFFAITGRETRYDVNIYPLTRILIGVIQQALTMSLMVVLAFYSAEVIWREKNCKFSEIIDALPTPNWVFVASKIAALALVMHAIVLLGIVIAISLQIMSGFEDFQLSNYIGRGLIYYTMAYVYLAVLSCFLQVLANNRLVGMLSFVIFMVLLVLSRDIFGVEHALLSYGLPGIAAPLSDMNSDSRFAIGGYWLRLYWGSIAGMLLLLTYVLWNRGTWQPLQYRLRQLRALKSKQFTIACLILATVFSGSGSYIFYNTNVLNKYSTQSDIEQLSLAYEQQYRQYQHLPMPHIIDVKIDVDIYPYQRRVEARSTQILQNKTEQSIDTVHLIFPVQAEVVSVALQGAVQQSVNTELAYYIFDLAAPMMPGDTLKLNFETLIQQHGFKNSRQDTSLVRNGSFISNNQLTPRIGFYDDLLLRDRNKRRDYGLDPLPRLPKLEDTHEHGNNYVSHDSDFIKFATTVSTVASQRAISPGYLVKEWVAGNRRYFSYKMDAPIMNYYGYLSADYEVAQDQWNGVDIEVLYHHAHDYNVQRMITSVKDSLAYYSEAFGPYQYRQLRILEFPGYRSFARAYPNTIPFSESIGFVADVTEPNEIDLPYYVTAHEVAHQWWAHQVMAANVQGGTMLVETLAQYSALLVMEQKYGKHQLRKFLKYELDRYLRSRAKDAEGEMPLFKVEHQPYIHYRKGAVVMYALRDYIGEQSVNRALKRLVNNHAYQSSPYALSTDLIDYLKQEADVQHHPLIEDLFEKITLFNLKLVQSSVTALPDGRFKVLLEVKADKYYQDSIGNQTEAAFDLPVDIGLFLKSPAHRDYGEEDVIMLEKRYIKSGEDTIEIIVAQKPLFAGIDPYHKLIDRDSNDNIAMVRDD